MAKPLIFDSTPLIHIAKVSLSNSLVQLDQPKFTTTSVYKELLKGEALGKPEARILRELIEEKAIKLQDPKDVAYVLKIVKIAAREEKTPLHKAEADVIALSRELDGAVISDDHVARSVARLVSVELHGTGYVLGRMYKARAISRDELLRKVGEMRRSAWRITEEDYESLLDYLRRL